MAGLASSDVQPAADGGPAVKRFPGADAICDAAASAFGRDAAATVRASNTLSNTSTAAEHLDQQRGRKGCNEDSLGDVGYGGLARV